MYIYIYANPSPHTHTHRYAVPVLRLADLLAALPWGPADQAGRLEVVEQLKIDAQGADVEVLKGAGIYAYVYVHVHVHVCVCVRVCVHVCVCV